jgi:hypothetical protein
MAALETWTAEACRSLGLDPTEVDERLVLDLARDTAHGVMRPAAPLSAYLLGVAVGRGADPRTAAAALTALATDWSTTDRAVDGGQ